MVPVHFVTLSLSLQRKKNADYLFVYRQTKQKWIRKAKKKKHNNSFSVERARNKVINMEMGINNDDADTATKLQNSWYWLCGRVECNQWKTVHDVSFIHFMQLFRIYYRVLFFSFQTRTHLLSNRKLQPKICAADREREETQRLHDPWEFIAAACERAHAHLCVWRNVYQIVNILFQVIECNSMREFFTSLWRTMQMLLTKKKKPNISVGFCLFVFSQPLTVSSHSQKLWVNYGFYCQTNRNHFNEIWHIAIICGVFQVSASRMKKKYKSLTPACCRSSRGTFCRRTLIFDCIKSINSQL